jgi:hypothetical protein
MRFLSHHAISRFGPLKLPLRLSLLLNEKQRETAKEQRAIPLFLGLRNCREPRISADVAGSLADNSREEQQKQRGAHAPLAAVQPVFDQPAGDRIQARQAE